MTPWAVINNQTNQTIKTFRTYYDALAYAALINRNSQSAIVRFVK